MKLVDIIRAQCRDLGTDFVIVCYVIFTLSALVLLVTIAVGISRLM